MAFFDNYNTCGCLNPPEPRSLGAEEGEFRKVEKRHTKSVKKFQGEGPKGTFRESGFRGPTATGQVSLFPCVLRRSLLRLLFLWLCHISAGTRGTFCRTPASVSSGQERQKRLCQNGLL